MEITKIINNNVVSGLDESGRETIWIGTGIGFHYKTEGVFDESIIQKKFHLEDSEAVSKFAGIAAGIPYGYIQTAEEIISIAHKKLRHRLDRSIHIGLTEHLCCAVERKNQGIELPNALLWEIKNYYPEEYAVGIEALSIIVEKLNIVLSEDEAGFIAIHIVNAEMGNFNSRGYDIVVMTKDIINIIQYHFQKDLDHRSFAFEELMVYIKHMLRRIITNQMHHGEDEEICALICTKFPSAYDCSAKIAKFILQQMKVQPNMEEIAYMTLNINRAMRDK